MRPVWLILAVTVVAPATAGEPGPWLKLLGTFEGARPSVYAPIAFSPDGKVLASSDYKRDAGAAVVKLWDVKERKAVATPRGDGGHSDHGIYSVAFSPDGKTLATGGRGLTLWDLATGKEKVTFEGRGPVTFSPDWRTFASADDRTVHLWETATGKRRASLKGQAGTIFSLAFSPDGKLLACGSGRSASNGQPSGGEVTIWDVATGRERASLKGRVKLRVTPRSLAYLRNAEGVPKRVLLKLAALNGKEFRSEEDAERALPQLLDKILDKDQRAKYLDAVRLEVKTVDEGAMVWVWSVAFSPDGKTLASGDVFGNVLLWDVQSGKRTATLQAFNPEGKEEDINGAYSVAFSPDGKTLAAGTWRGIRLWDVGSGEKVGGLIPSATVWSVAFSPDGKTLASAGSKRVIGQKDRIEGDETINLWELILPRKGDE